jgi:heme A synthase
MVLAALFLWTNGPGRIPRYGLLALAAQVLLGLLNIALLAPGWMQILHLLVAQVLWVLAWITTVECWPRPQSFRIEGLTAAGSRA